MTVAVAMDSEETWINQVFCEDALAGLARIPDGSIDLILTDPPYNLGKDYGNDSDSQTVEEYLRWTEQWICLLYTSPSPRDRQKSRMPSSA